MNHAEPRIGVFIPTRDRPELLAETLRSVLAQTRPADDILVSDNAPKTPCERVVAEAGGGRCRYVHHAKLLGMEEHWLWGIQAVATDFWCFLSDDDLWRPRHLEHLLAAVRALPGRGIYGAASLAGAGARMPFAGDLMAPIWTCDALGGTPEDVTPGLFVAASLIGPPFASCATMLNLTKAPVVRPEPSETAISLDAWLWAQFAAAHGAVSLPEITSIYRVHGDNTIRRFSRAAYAANNARHLANLERLCQAHGIDLAEALRQLPDRTSEASLTFFAQNLLRMHGAKRGGELLGQLAKGRNETWRRAQRRLRLARIASFAVERFLS